MLLRVAARLRRGSRVGLYVGRQAQTLAIRLLQPAAAVQQCTIEKTAGRQAPPRAKSWHGLGLHRRNRAVRRLD